MGIAIPRLIGDLLGLLYFSLALLFVLTYFFSRDVTALLATGGIGLAILGFAMQDTLYSLISGIMLNMERALKIGDRVRFYQDQIKITFYAESIAEHGNVLARAVMKQVLERLQAVGISPSYPKLELYFARKHQQIADHQLDRFYFISQIGLFKDLPEAYRRQLATMMVGASYNAGQLISDGDKEMNHF